MMNFGAAIALITAVMSVCLAIESAASQIKLSTNHPNQVELRVRNLGAAPVEALQIGGLDKQAPRRSFPSGAIMPTNASRARRAPTTTVRPSHGQIPRPAVMKDDELVTSTRSL